MNQEDIDELSSLRSPVAKLAVEFINNVISSPYYDGYKAVWFTITTLNKEIQESAIILSEEDKRFDKINKYIIELKPYYETLDYLRLKLTPEQTKSANEEVRSLFERAHSDVKLEKK